MKRGVARFSLLVVLTLVCVTSIASAAVCSNPSQTILRLSANTNAQAELWNGSGAYTQEVCYDTIFGVTYGGASPHTCTGSNEVVGLSASTNAHSEYPALTTYTTQVCYGNLICTPRQGACQGTEREIISLSANTNAQAELASSNVYTDKICCSSSGQTQPACSDGIDNDGDTRVDFPADSGCTSVSDTDETDTAPSTGSNFTLVQWQNSAGTPIGRSFSVGTAVNRTVRLVAQTQFPVGTGLTFDISEDDSVSDDSIRTLTASTGAGGQALVSLTITDADIQAGRSQFNDEDANQVSQEFYFTVRTTMPISGEVNTSQIVDVSTVQGPNVPPSTIIVAPVHRGIYFNDTTVEFRQASQDIDGDSMTYLWTITEDSFTTTNVSFNYTFRSTGQKTVTLRATDSHGAWSERQVGLVVIWNQGMVAFIQQPSHLAVLVNNTLRVRVSANDSYVVKSENACPGVTVTCLAGACPSQTQNWPAGAGCVAPFTVSQTPRGFNELYFDWTFSDGDNAGAVEGYGASTVTKQFGQPSSGLTDYKRADLSLRYTNNTAGFGGINLLKATSRSFTLLNARQCTDNGNTWVEYDYTTGQVVGTWSTLQANNRCAGADGLVGGGDDCCPTGQACTGSGSASCQPINGTSCSYYQDENECEDDDSNLAPIDPSWDSECGTSLPNGTIVTCACNWINQTTTSGNYCVFSKDYGQGTHNNTSGCTPHQCNYLPDPNGPTECINGYATVTVNAQFIGGTCAGLDTSRSACQAGNGQRTILCGRPTISLDFFGPGQFVLTLVVIAGIYLVGWLRKRV